MTNNDLFCMSNIAEPNITSLEQERKRTQIYDNNSPIILMEGNSDYHAGVSNDDLYDLDLFNIEPSLPTPESGLSSDPDPFDNEIDQILSNEQEQELLESLNLEKRGGYNNHHGNHDGFVSNIPPSGISYENQVQHNYLVSENDDKITVTISKKDYEDYIDFKRRRDASCDGDYGCKKKIKMASLEKFSDENTFNNSAPSDRNKSPSETSIVGQSTVIPTIMSKEERHRRKKSAAKYVTQNGSPSEKETRTFHCTLKGKHGCNDNNNLGWRQKDRAIEHIRTVHNGETFTCQFCGTEHKREDNLIAHIKHHHIEGVVQKDSFKCPVYIHAKNKPGRDTGTTKRVKCGYVCKGANELRRHLKIKRHGDLSEIEINNIVENAKKEVRRTRYSQENTVYLGSN